MEYWDRNGNVDISMVMDWIGGHSTRKHASDKHNGGTPQQEIEEAWNCPELETLTLKSYYEITEQKQTREARSRWFDGEGSGADGSAGTWMMPSFKWDPTVQDGTAFLLDADQDSIGPSVDMAKDNDQEMEGQETIKRFLRYISPGRKLKKLRLAQVQLVKAKGNEALRNALTVKPTMLISIDSLILIPSLSLGTISYLIPSPLILPLSPTHGYS
jgi:hypothetical protein